MCEFHDSNGNGFGDIWWTDKLIYFSSIDDAVEECSFIISHLAGVRDEEGGASPSNGPSVPGGTSWRGASSFMTFGRMLVKITVY